MQHCHIVPGLLGGIQKSIERLLEDVGQRRTYEDVEDTRTQSCVEDVERAQDVENEASEWDLGKPRMTAVSFSRVVYFVKGAVQSIVNTNRDARILHEW